MKPMLIPYNTRQSEYCIPNKFATYISVVAAAETNISSDLEYVNNNMHSQIYEAV